MEIEDASKIRKGTVMFHVRKGKVIARGSVSEEYVWIDVPEDPVCPDIPYRAHISRLEFVEQ